MQRKFVPNTPTHPEKKLTLPRHPRRNQEVLQERTARWRRRQIYRLKSTAKVTEVWTLDVAPVPSVSTERSALTTAREGPVEIL